MSIQVIGGFHVGRSWEGDRIERECPCDNAPCGLAISDTANDCPEHSPRYAKTLRQGHRADMCPATTPAVDTTRDTKATNHTEGPTTGDAS